MFDVASHLFDGADEFGAEAGFAAARGGRADDPAVALAARKRPLADERGVPALASVRIERRRCGGQQPKRHRFAEDVDAPARAGPVLRRVGENDETVA